MMTYIYENENKYQDHYNNLGNFLFLNRSIYCINLICSFLILVVTFAFGYAFSVCKIDQYKLGTT